MSEITTYQASLDMPDLILPAPTTSGLTADVNGFDENGQEVTIPVVGERARTIYLNRQEVITAMTLGDWPQCLSVGFLRNQHMLADNDVITAIDVDDELDVIVVRTEKETNYEAKLQKKVRTSGCAQGTMFGDVMDKFDAATLNPEARLKTSTLMALTKTINQMDSLYLTAGAIHGCVLAKDDNVLAYMEDVGRHNAVDKIAGWMFLKHIEGQDKIFYTTGRLTSEMVIKTVTMGIPILVSRSGFTESGVELARQAGLTLIGRARGKRFTVLSGPERVVYDRDPMNDDPSSDPSSDWEQLSPQRQKTGGKTGEQAGEQTGGLVDEKTVSGEGA